MQSHDDASSKLGSSIILKSAGDSMAIDGVTPAHSIFGDVPVDSALGTLFQSIDYQRQGYCSAENLAVVGTLIENNITDVSDGITYSLDICGEKLVQSCNARSEVVGPIACSLCGYPINIFGRLV